MPEVTLDSIVSGRPTGGGHTSGGRNTGVQLANSDRDPRRLTVIQLAALYGDLNFCGSYIRQGGQGGGCPDHFLSCDASEDSCFAGLTLAAFAADSAQKDTSRASG